MTRANTHRHHNFLHFGFIFSVVAPEFLVETHNAHVIVGNSGFMKCEIPSFVSDFVAVSSWIDNDDIEYPMGMEYPTAFGKNEKNA